MPSRNVSLSVADFATLNVVRAREDKLDEAEIPWQKARSPYQYDGESSPGPSSACGNGPATDGDESCSSTTSFEIIDPDSPYIQAEQRNAANAIYRRGVDQLLENIPSSVKDDFRDKSVQSFDIPDPVAWPDFCDQMQDYRLYFHEQRTFTERTNFTCLL